MLNKSKLFLAGCTVIALSSSGTSTLANEAAETKARELVLATGIEVANFKGPGNFDGLGRIAGTAIYYGHSCDATSFGKIVLVRATDKQVWSYDQGCVSNVSWRDIDGDGVPEFRFSSSGGGSGARQVRAIFFRWPAGNAQPTEIAKFLSYSYESWGGAYSKYGFEPKKFYNFEFYENNFLPVGASCTSSTKCDIVERKTFCIDQCSVPVPKDMTQDPGWPAFVAALAVDGYQSGNLQPSGDEPEVTKETQEAFDAWLSE